MRYHFILVGVLSKQTKGQCCMRIGRERMFTVLIGIACTPCIYKVMFWQICKSESWLYKLSLTWSLWLLCSYLERLLFWPFWGMHFIIANKGTHTIMGVLHPLDSCLSKAPISSHWGSQGFYRWREHVQSTVTS